MNVDFITAIKLFFANYANFKGRSTRAEYWWAMLFTFLVSLVLSVFKLQLLNSLAGLAFFIPSLAILTRRFHDVNRSGWWVVGLYVVTIAAVAIGFGSSIMQVAMAGPSAGPEVLIESIQANSGKIGICGIIAFAAGILALIWCCTPSKPDNQYGPNPYGEEA